MLPVIAIIGRQNVGKSTLFNAILKRRISIVEPTPGVTRDRISGVATHNGKQFELVDTGGVGLDESDDFYKQVNRQIDFAIKEADAIIFLVDAKTGLTPLDAEIAQKLRSKSKKVIFTMNKADNKKMELSKSDFSSLGFDQPLALSAMHKRGVDELLDKVFTFLPLAPSDAEEPLLKIAIVGKRNVGKSTFINTLVGEERVIVSEKPGTTRDAVDVLLQKDEKTYLLIDTAGLRKRTKVEDAIEFFSVVRTNRAIERADTVIFMLDITERISAVDKQIGDSIERIKKPCVIALNKWDLACPVRDTNKSTLNVSNGAGERKTGEFIEYINKVMSALSYVPIVICSAANGQNVWDIIRIVEELHMQASFQITTSRLNQVLDKIVRKRTPYSKGTKIAKIFYATQTGKNPPQFLVFVNDRRIFGDDYIRYIENCLREELPIGEVPIDLQLRNRPKVVLEKK